MILDKVHYIIDESIKDKSFKKSILKKNINYHPKDSNVIVVIGGDGFMLETLKKYYRYDKPFYGMNKGTFGFLMNKFKVNNIKKSISKSKLITIPALEMTCISTKNIKKSAIAINEISLLRQSRQTASLRVFNKKRVLIKKLISDGILISTPAGSTAYNLSAGGPILPLNSKKIAITPISPFRPRRLKGKTLSNNSEVIIYNLNTKKRPISAVADNIEVRNIKNIKVKINKIIKFELLFDKGNGLAKKIKLELFKKKY